MSDEVRVRGYVDDPDGVGDGAIGACRICGFIVSKNDDGTWDSCACTIARGHPNPECRFRISSTCAVPIECEHGYDVCPKCDPCTCAMAETPPKEKDDV